MKLLRWFSALVVMTTFTGCVSSTQVIRNKQATVSAKDYRDVYFVPPKEDSRNIGPRAVDEFKSMGFNVKTVDPNKPLDLQGTGFVISADGYVLTCAHVLADDANATVWLGGTRLAAEVVEKDKDRDLALLKITTPTKPALQPLNFSGDKRYSLGAEVFTIGFPLGNVLGSSIRYTKGSISATSGLKDDAKQLQVSAEIQPGNSGGPLFNKDGMVIGVVQQTLNPLKVLSDTGGSLPQNVNFAIKGEVVVDFLKTKHADLIQPPSSSKVATVDEVQKSVVKIQAGTISGEEGTQAALIARLDYVSMWDLWYRFRLFVVRVYDLDTHELLFAAGQGRDNMVSNEEVVIKDTFDEVRKELHKPRTNSTH